MPSFDELKAAGTKALNAGDVAAAAARYTEALALAADDTAKGALQSNLSLCHLKLGNTSQATASADACVRLRPSWEKGYFRKAEAAFAEGRDDTRRYADAVKLYEAGLSAAPGDATIAGRLALAREAVKGFYFRQLLPGRDIAVNAVNAIETQIFVAAKQMQNFIYVVGDAWTRQCVVIDACWDVRGIEALVEKDKMTLVGAVATHYHFDHTGGMPPPPFNAMGITVPGIRELEMRGLPVHCHAEDAREIMTRNHVAKENMTTHADGAMLSVGAITLRFLHTPGHSPGSMIVVVDGAQQGDPGAGAGLVVSGDTIFPGSCGRLDLPDASAERMFDSLAKCARVLTDDMIVYPGHNYAGASSTVRREKESGLLRPFTKTQWMTMHPPH
mmetsp:Transcript_34205/g.86082  ORF Transcript_34205/g.86082 Transcript_34205/m.86082 type:complete len:387 (-) Transcript_34205:27-1187(-)